MSLLAATDLSTRSAAAIRFAEELSERLDEPLTVAHIAPATEGDVVDDAAGALAQFLREYAGKPENILTSVPAGDTIDVLIREARDFRLLACGATGSSYLDDIFLGSTASRLIREAPCPVLVVPDGYVPGLDKIVVAVGLDLPSGKALEIAADLAASCNASLCLVHAVPAGTSAEAQAEAHERVTALGEPFDVRCETRVVVGEPAQSVRAAVTEEEADLIVMGTHGRPHASQFFLGSVAERVVRRPPCPVLTVRTQAD
jgi:nucleotide-binding universal stress UspA family protein